MAKPRNRKPKAVPAIPEAIPAPTQETVPMSNITIAGESYAVPSPYTSGHTLTEGEASALNQLLAENLRNNMAGRIKKAKEAGSFDHTEFQSLLDDYASKYEFGVRAPGGRAASGPRKDPVQAEAFRIAKETLVNALKSQGKKVGGKDGYSNDQIKDAVNRMLEKDTKYVEMAKQRIAENQAAASESLEDLLGEPAGEAPATVE